jgi:hypothetical protein
MKTKVEKEKKKVSDIKRLKNDVKSRIWNMGLPKDKQEMVWDKIKDLFYDFDFQQRKKLNEAKNNWYEWQEKYIKLEKKLAEKEKELEQEKYGAKLARRELIERGIK